MIESVPARPVPDVFAEILRVSRTARRDEFTATRFGASGDNDIDMVERLRTGDREVFTQLYELYAPTLHRLALRYVTTNALAEDVVQDTWLAVLEGVDRFQGRSSFRTWVCTILVYKAQRQAARERRVVPFSAAFVSDLDRVESQGDATPEVAGPALRLVMGGPGTSGEPATVFTTNEVLAALRRLIDTLPARQRAAVLMVDVEGRPPDEACQVLGVSPGNLRLLLHRGRQRVRRAWQAL